MRIYLILQRQLEELFNSGKVKRITIKRLDAKQWFPLFEVSGAGEEIITCSLRVQASPDVRTWANLTLLAEWLLEKFEVEKCELILSEASPPSSIEEQEK